MIGRREYEMLSKLDKTLTETDLIKISEYEHSKKPIVTQSQKDYFKKVHTANKEFKIKIDSDKLLISFLKAFKHTECKEFNSGDGRGANLETLINYFSKNDAFLNSARLCRSTDGKFISKPSFDKGLLIIGDFGCGKSSMMRAFKTLFDGHSLTFKSYTTNKIVTNFESYTDTSERTAYMNRTKTKTAYFDDVKTEKEASNYGLHNLMKDIIEERYNNNALTYMTCNYVLNDSSKSIPNALREFDSKYGARVFDRLFEMFNIIEFKGSSLRK